MSTAPTHPRQTTAYSENGHAETPNGLQDLHLQKKIERKKEAGLYRTLIAAEGHIDFSSNDYFGLSKHETLRNTGQNTLPAGATGSRSISGNSQLAEETEAAIARFHQREAALIFNSGYMANCGLFSCLADRGDTYIADELIHASIIDGMRLSHAHRLRFRHNNTGDLELKLQNSSGKKIVVAESVYSMDGDTAPLTEIVRLCKKYQALLIVDEAHGTGVFGNKGEGLVAALGLQNEVYACIHTFGKALGLHGAAVTGSQILRQYLINHARSFIYTTALPPHTYLQIREAYRLIAEADRKGLGERIRFFRHCAQNAQPWRFLDSKTPIQGILPTDILQTRALAEHLLRQGFFVKAIVPPSVAAGKERIRICLHSFNTHEEIGALFHSIQDFKAG
jgi:8-amino-7-oxononanoate synthase